jgi:SSS family solute:Na+ symporter
VVSLLTPRTDRNVMDAWDRRVAGEVPEDVPVRAAR